MFGWTLALAAAPVAAAPVPAATPSLAVAPAVVTRYYPADANAAAQVEGAVAEARAGGRRAVLVFGADWCSDSTALAAVLKSDLWQALFGKRYSLTFIDVNRPTKGEGRNQDVIARFGIDKMTGTPELLVIGSDGKPVNSVTDAHSWRDAGERPVSAILKWFFRLDKPAGAADAAPASAKP